MKTQYLIGRAPVGGRDPTPTSRFEFKRQQPGALDMVPGYLDLPSGTLQSHCVRRFLNFSALFNEHLIIPDGWFHCTGPLSEYLRVHFRQAQTWPGQHNSPRFAADPLLQYLQAGIIVPGLRGDRPSSNGEDPIGFDLLKVWSGITDVRGARRGYGVAFLDNVERMAILDYDNDENKALLGLISNSTRLFVDWTSPTVPVTEVGFDSKRDRELWDQEFTTAVQAVVLDAPLGELGVEAIMKLLEIGAAPCDVLPIVKEFWFALLDAISSDVKRSNRFRRGSVERAVGAQFGLDRFRSYDLLVTGAMDDVVTAHPLSALHPTAPTIQLRSILARTLLDRVSTLQQAMFARKFVAEFGFPRRPTPDIIDRGLFKMSGHQSDVEEFVDFNEVIWPDEIPFENLTTEQVMLLRSKHSDFFAAFREANPAPDFWRANRDLLDYTRAYISDIAGAIPLSSTTKGLIRTTRRVVVGGGIAAVVAMADPWKAGLKLGAGGLGLWWCAKKSLPPITRWLTNAFDDRIEQEIMKWRASGYADVMLQALDIHTETPDTARSASAV